MNKKTIIAVAITAIVAVGATVGIMAGMGGKKSAVIPMDKDVQFGDYKLAVFSVGRMHREAKASQYISEQKEKYEKQLADEVKVQQEKFKKEEASLEKQRGALSQELYTKKVKEYLEKTQAAEKEVRTKAEALQKSISVALQKLENDHIRQVITELVEANEYRVVLSDAGVVFHAEKDDITKKVVELLDDRVTKPDFEKPKGFK